MAPSLLSQETSFKVESQDISNLHQAIATRHEVRKHLTFEQALPTVVIVRDGSRITGHRD